MTVKALRCMEESDLIVLPAADPAGCHAYQIARKAYPGIEKKELEDVQDSVDPGICLYERGACSV